MNKLYLVFIVLLISVFVVSCASLVKPESEQKTMEQIKKSVVRISSENQMSGEKREGTGFVVGVSNDKAYIVTVSHVVEGDPKPTVEFFENNKFEAEVLDNESQGNGLALLSVEGQIPYDVMPLYLVKKRNIKSGDTVFTFGFPRGGTNWSYDKLSYSGQKLRNLLFSDSDITEGNSGSPIIKGEQVVAMITSVTNHAFANSAENIRDFLLGATGGATIINEMEKWKPSKWRRTQEARRQNAKFVINEQARLKEIELKIAAAKERLRNAKEKVAATEKARLQIEDELKQVKADAKVEAKLIAAEQTRKQAEIEALQAKADVEKAEQQRITAMLLQTKLDKKGKKKSKKTDKTVFQDHLKDGSLGPKMVWIQAGKFRMGDIQGGDEDERPIHNIHIKRFAIGQFELTVGEFKKFVKTTKYKTNAEKGNGCQKWTGSAWKQNVRFNWQKVGFSQNDSHPVTCVSWHDAVAYTKWLSKQTERKYRLPTEAEWEYAAKARTTTKYWWGNNIGKNRANCNGCGSQRSDKTAPVGSFARNDFKLYDVIGNLWEWTCSEYDNKYRGKERHCIRSVKNKKQLVLRGGSWGSKPNWIRSANRHFYNPNSIYNSVGFRIVRK